MKRFRIALALALVAAPLAPASSQYVLNFREADIRAFIEDAARVTGRTFIIDAAVQGRVSVVTQRPVSRSEYFELFLSTLRANGMVAVPAPGGALRVQPVATAASSAGRVGRRPTSPSSFVTEIIRLRSIDPATAIEAVRPLVSREGSVTAGRNSIIVADFADNIARVRQIVASIDRDTSATRLVALENAGPREIAEALRALVGQEGARAGVSIVPIDSANSIALRGDAATVARLVEMARDLDRRAASGTELRVVFLEHADAQQLLPVLQQLLGQAVSPASNGASRLPVSTGRRTTLGGTGNGTTMSEAPPPPPIISTAPSAGSGLFGG